MENVAASSRKLAHARLMDSHSAMHYGKSLVAVLEELDDEDRFFNHELL
jgi:hypothetical protein